MEPSRPDTWVPRMFLVQFYLSSGAEGSNPQFAVLACAKFAAPSPQPSFAPPSQTFHAEALPESTVLPLPTQAVPVEANKTSSNSPKFER